MIKSVKVLLSEGPKVLTKHVRERLGDPLRATRTRGVMTIMSKRDIPTFFNFILGKSPDSQKRPAESTAKTINWLIPDFGIGSGGHLNIFRYVSHLEQYGYDCRIVIVGHHRHKSTEAAAQEIREHFFPLQAEVHFGDVGYPSSVFSFATSWITAYYLRPIENTRHKLYFVQDFEPYFYPHGSEYAFAEATYGFGFTAVTAGQWLHQKMTRDYKASGMSLGFSYDRNLYKQHPRREPALRRVFCYVRPPTVRRGLESAFLALDLVGKALPDVKFIFAGWDVSDFEFRHEHLNAGLVPIPQLPDLYSQCDVALVLSFTNASLLPLELMACGCCVVSNSGDNVEWLLSSSNSALSAPDPESLAKTIVELLIDDNRRARLQRSAKEFAESTSWENYSMSLHEFLEKLDVCPPTRQPT